MENKINHSKNIILNYGVILGLILIAINVTSYATGIMLKGEQWPNYIYYIIFPVFIILGIKKFKTLNSGELLLAQGLKTGMGIAAISALVYVIYHLLFTYVIDPTFIDKMVELTETKLIEAGMDDAQIEQTLTITRKMSNPLVGSGFWILLSAFFGFVYSLIASVIMKGEKPYKELDEL
ncbi:DUF4199 domain-containing protein [Pseudofulvibacter geojedonensis]|uniref:DUF4199 domain-containing protein n=1 Tax=Pseudofulvibacter geojedonensis TaxID=1123758 RepID=A0ABW3HZI0_9FLAO